MGSVHYALVDDLYGEEEFRRRVEEKIEETGGLIDEHTAAMLVVRDAGREHVSINGLSATSSLACFFGKVLKIGKPREFARQDGTPGVLLRILVGDESGEVCVLLWDDYARSATEIVYGDVLEIVGRPKRQKRLEVHALALRKAACDIRTRDLPTRGEPAPREDQSLEVRLLAVGDIRQFRRGDGTEGEMQEAVIGDETGSARLVCWTPALLNPFSPDDVLRIEGARQNTESPEREYSIGESSTIQILDRSIQVPFTPVSEIGGAGRFSIQGRIAAVVPPRRFTTRKGTSSWVRQVRVADEGGEVRVVLWGDQALMHLEPDVTVALYNAAFREGRNGVPEIHAGFGSAIRTFDDEAGEITFEGTVIDTRYGRCIDNGTRWYLLDGDLPLGSEVRIRGIARGRYITPLECEPVVRDPQDLIQRLNRLFH
jgi:replication factor A1